ncbi:hypothetical protein Pyrfu_1011 [Pyrolobus fumarii 1A]|uniref:Uncharacterized protein n=1 Tax=Pyrolobus fumarii (strain DSM 11204 / 1A) TaxID=694429 RepID=G0EEQ7_PYRF1|nr:hypothetical protein [Pyrolobus fumarii]AEM38879.1 hypothetical protein Pyrfu_1011 [Pyrolobus fumarii 1A]
MAGRVASLLEGWRRVWLLPFLHVIIERGGASTREVADTLGVRTTLVKSALYALRRAGVIVKINEGERVRYVPAPGVAEEYSKLFRIVKLDGDYAAFTGSHYIYVDIKKSRVSSWVLPEYIVEKVLEAYQRMKDARPSEIGRALGLHGRTVSRALRVSRFLGLAPQRVEDEGSLGNRA